MIYLDGILIYSNNISEHYWHVKKVLKHLCKTSLYTKVEKCKFYSKLVEYLGYILFSFGLTIFNNKVKIIQDWPEPKKVKDIQSFLDFTNFYYWFIFNYLDIVISLTYLIWKDILLWWCFQLTKKGIYLHSYSHLLDSQCSTHCENWYFKLCSCCNSFYY